MGAALANLPVGQLGPVGLLGLVVWMILTGRLVTRRQLQDVQADRDHWRTAADGWQGTATKLGMTVEGLTTSVEQILPAVAASTHALEEIQLTLRERSL